MMILRTLWGNPLLNELMIDPEFSENSSEYVEILNRGESAVNLSGWFFGDAGDMDLLIFFEDSVLNAGEYALILDPDYEGEYDEIIPDSVLCLTIEDSRFGAYGLSNSTPKTYYLMDSAGRIADSCRSFTGMPEGYSMERDHEGSWQISRRRGGTPGFYNSVCPPDSAELHVIIDSSRRKGIRIYADLLIYNAGRLPVSSFELSLTDSLTGRQFFFQMVDKTLSAGDSLMYSTEWITPIYGRQKVLWDIHYEESGRQGSFEHTIAVPSDSLFITEFCPVPGEDISCEYIEFYNSSSRPVNLYGMTVSDKTGTADLVSEDFVLPKLGLGVAAAKPDLQGNAQSPFLLWVPPAWRALNNGGDCIIIKDERGSHLESLEYDGSWPVKTGFGIERKSLLFPAERKENWQAGFSPGQKNSADWPDTLFCIEEVEFSFPPPEIRFILKNCGEKILPETKVHVALDLDGSGRVFPENMLDVKTSIPLDREDSLVMTVWPELSVAGFLNILFQLPALSDTVFAFECLYPWPEKSLVINEYCPWPGDIHGSEYYELLIRGNYTLNLKGFSFSDRTGTVTWPRFLMAEPGEYVVFSENRELHHYFPEVCARIPEAWRSLNNGEDCLVIYGPSGRMMDSVDYVDAPEDIPYQRYSPDLSSHLSMNWIEKTPGTPGAPNPFQPQSVKWHAGLRLKDRRDGIVTLYIILVNKGIQSAPAPYLEVKTCHPRGQIETVSRYSPDIFLSPGDSLKDSLAVFRDVSGTTRWFLEGAKVISDTVDIYIPYKDSPLTLNEVMNCPESSDPAEWIELAAVEYPLLIRNWFLGVNDRLFPFSADIDEALPLLSHEKWQNQYPVHPVDGFPALINKGFIIRLFDSDTTLMDSVDLRDHTDFTPGVSLENPVPGKPFIPGVSWRRSRSAAGHTGGEKNSIYMENEAEQFLTADPRVLLRNAEEPMCITVCSHQGLAYGEIHILTVTGNPVRQFKKNAFSSPLIQVFWDGTYSDGYPVPAGMYLVYSRVRRSDGSKKEGMISVITNFP